MTNLTSGDVIFWCLTSWAAIATTSGRGREVWSDSEDLDPQPFPLQWEERPDLLPSIRILKAEEWTE